MNKYLSIIKYLIIIITIILLFRLFRLSRIFFSNQYIESFLDSNELIINKNNVLDILKNGIISDPNITDIVISNANNKKENKSWNIEDKLPDLLHFIWIGSKIPEKYIDNVLSYSKNNPNYIIYIWLDNNTLDINNNNLDKLPTNIQLHNIDEINLINEKGFNLMTNYGGKADILRYEIIYNYGGMYIDIDSRSKKSFDDIFYKPYVCIELKFYNNIQNAQFGFSKKSPFLDFVIITLGKNIDYHLSNNRNLNDILSISGPPFFTTCYYYWQNLDIQCINQYYVIHNNPESYNYHTNDANWIENK